MKKILASLVLALGISATFMFASPANAAVAKNADKTFVYMMASKYNKDHKLFTRPSGISVARWTKLLHNLGVADCGLIKAYDIDESPKNALIDTLLYIESQDRAPYTNAGDAFQVVSAVDEYCTQYKKTLKSM